MVNCNGSKEMAEIEVPVLCLPLAKLVNHINTITSAAYATAGGVIIRRENRGNALRIVIMRRLSPVLLPEPDGAFASRGKQWVPLD